MLAFIDDIFYFVGREEKIVKRLTLFFLLIWVIPVTGQNVGTITGRVIDAGTQEVLFGANVILVGTNRGAASDSEGYFEIENVPVGNYSVQFLYLGYETVFKSDVVVRSARPVTVNAELIPSLVEGEEIVVTAGYFGEEEKTPPSVIALSREEIRRFPGGFEDVVRTVSTLPGVAINMSQGRNDLLVRGGGPSENLYLINNIEIPNINHFGSQGFTGGSLSFVNLDFVEDVTFSTGGFGAAYGDKMSSVISLTMLSEIPKQVESKLTISATQFGADLEAPLGKGGSVILSARKSYLDLIFKAAGLPFVPVYTDYNVILNYELSPKDRLFVIGLSAINDVDRNQSSLENRVFNASVLGNSQYKGITGLNYRRLIRKGFVDVTASVNLSRYNFRQIDEEEDVYFSSDADEWEYGLKIQHTWTATKRLVLRSGISAKFINNVNATTFADTIIDRSGQRIPSQALGLPADTDLRQKLGKHAGFVEADWRVTPLIGLNLGIRSELYPFLDQVIYLAPRFSLKYRIHPKQSLRISGGIYHQSPAYVWLVNPMNSRLSAFENRMGVLGWDLLVRRDTRISLETYYKDYRHLPTGTIPGVSDYFVLTNTGSSYGGREDDFQSFGYYNLVSEGMGKAYGAEFLAQKKFSDLPFYGQLSITWNKSRFTAGNGLTSPGQFDQRFIVNVSGGYIFNSRWQVSGKFRYFTGVPYTPVYRPSENPLNPGAIQNLPEEYLTARVAPGHHLDLRVDRTWYLGGVTLITYVDVQNVYNYKIPMIPQYDFWEDKIEDSASIGVLPSIGISVEF